MNARQIWPHLLTQLHTHLIALARRKLVCMERMDMIMDTKEEKVETGLLKPLFEARLQYQSDMEVVVSAETREGELVGSGDGSVSGDRLSGTVRWSMYAGNCAYVGCREPDLSRHPANIFALFILLVLSKRPTRPKSGLTPEAMGYAGLTRANPICGGSRWRSNLRPRTGATSG